MQVEVSPRADATYGLIQRRHFADRDFRAELEGAYRRLIGELRVAHHSIWCIPASQDEYPDCFVLYDPPLRCYFRRIQDGKIGVTAFEETREPEQFEEP
jgi:hypothetical protein